MKVGDLVRHKETDGLVGIIISIQGPGSFDRMIYYIQWSRPTPWTNSYTEWATPDVLEVYYECR
jgi:hypothetical protein